MTYIVSKNTSKKEFQKLLNKKSNKRKLVNLDKYCGIVKLEKDALAIQKKLRNEWR